MTTDAAGGARCSTGSRIPLVKVLWKNAWSIIPIRPIFSLGYQYVEIAWTVPLSLTSTKPLGIA